MAASSRAQVLRLYRALLRESQRFSCYGYRTYAIRRIKDAFRENKNITDSEKIEELLNKAKVNLQVIQRQVTIGQMYATEKLVIECPEDTQPRKASDPETTLGHLQHPTVPRTETAHAHV
ncbi:LYR motif-containing protein 4 isoform X2 [Agelaius phoeniceus]|uniref:LYR motif-containing protein 4 isoform X2 n=1 Tax=Agelaius phoeniceus TaxID=39638 RepID=UPI0023EC4332|nr:LYR motif-containing protein 4 isoform X3 [Agelaius phoeniceus]